jgi:hypothetical protein
MLPETTRHTAVAGRFALAVKGVICVKGSPGG